jgi:uncharacterized protein (TIGR02145 family)
MSQNLNVGTRIDKVSEQTDNSILEKYCYNNSTAQCDNYGALYQWDEAMQYSEVEGARGICPVGWHLPTDAEWTTLTQTVISDPGCDPSTGCTPAGEILKASATSTPVAWDGTNTFNFTAIPSSYRDLDGTCNYQGTYGFLWTSKIAANNTAYHRFFNIGDTTIVRGFDFQAYGFAVRCIQD